MKWLIEKNLWDHEDAMVASIERVGQEVDLLDYVPMNDPDYIPEQTGEVVFYGSLNLATRLRKREDIRRGVFCNLKNFECSKYYAYFNEHLLNSDYLFISYSELIRMKDFLFDSFGIDDTIFVRPSSGFKWFTGQTTSIDTFEKDVNYMGFYGIDPHDLVVVSSPKKITREYRFIVNRDRVITGSLYMDNDDQIEREIMSGEEIFSVAQSFVNCVNYIPEEMWILDLCSTPSDIGDEIKVLEIGAFSSSGFYRCNTDIIVDEITQLLKEV